MERLYGSGEKGLIEEIKNRALENPIPINLIPCSESEGGTYRINAAITEFEYGNNVREAELQEQLQKIKSKKVRLKVEKAAKQKQERAASGRLKGYRTQQRNGAIMAMILDWVWSDELANLHEISKSDVQHYYSILHHMRAYFNVEADKEFIEYLKLKAIEAYKIETEKVNEYQKGLAANNISSSKPLRKLLASKAFKRENLIPPRLVIEDELYGKDDQGLNAMASLRHNLDSYSTTTEDGDRFWFHNGKQITQHEYRTKGASIEKEIKVLQKRHAQLRKYLFLDNEANKHVTFIKAIGIKELKSVVNPYVHIDRINQEDFKQLNMSFTEYAKFLENKSKNEGLTKYEKSVFMPNGTLNWLSKINVTSVGQGEALLKKYAAWHLRTYREEIKETQAEEEARRTALKNEKLRIENRVKRLERDKDVIDLLNTGETNKAEIARQLDLKPRSVREIVQRYQAVLDLHNKGVRVPEAISEQTGTKLSTVVYYLELITGEDVSSNTLTTQQGREIAQQREEERRAREAIYLREIKRIEREEIQKGRETIEREVVQLHNIGFCPTRINKKMALVSTTEAVNILKNRGIKPHFDYQLATDEERQAEKERIRVQFEKDNRNRPRIDL